MFRDDKRSLIAKICFHKRQDASGKTGVIGAHSNDQWLQERINSEAENNLGEIQSSEFIEMIEKREKNSHNFQIHLGKFSPENCPVEHCDDKYDAAGAVNNVDMTEDLTGKITGCKSEEAFHFFAFMFGERVTSRKQSVRAESCSTFLGNDFFHLLGESNISYPGGD